MSWWKVRPNNTLGKATEGTFSEQHAVARAKKVNAPAAKLSPAAAAARDRARRRKS